MESLSSFVPQWASILFLIVIFIPVFLIAGLARKGTIDSASKNRMYLGIILFYLLYFIYVAFASFSGWFDPVALPPIILRYTMIPLLLFLLIVIFNLKATKEIVDRLSASDLIRVHIFRLIGVFFLIHLVYNALPKPMALMAGLGDIITAVSSLWVAKKLEAGHSRARTWALAWNTFGLADILLTSASAMYFTKQSIDTGSLGVDALAAFPFCFIPAFAPATIIFLHLLVYRKLLKRG